MFSAALPFAYMPGSPLTGDESEASHEKAEGQTDSQGLGQNEMARRGPLRQSWESIRQRKLMRDAKKKQTAAQEANDPDNVAEGQTTHGEEVFWQSKMVHRQELQEAEDNEVDGQMISDYNKDRAILENNAAIADDGAMDLDVDKPEPIIDDNDKSSKESEAVDKDAAPTITEKKRRNTLKVYRFDFKPQARLPNAASVGERIISVTNKMSRSEWKSAEVRMLTEATITHEGVNVTFSDNVKILLKDKAQTATRKLLYDMACHMIENNHGRVTRDVEYVHLLSEASPAILEADCPYNEPIRHLAPRLETRIALMVNADGEVATPVLYSVYPGTAIDVDFHEAATLEGHITLALWLRSSTKLNPESKGEFTSIEERWVEWPRGAGRKAARFPIGLGYKTKDADEEGTPLMYSGAVKTATKIDKITDESFDHIKSAAFCIEKANQRALAYPHLAKSKGGTPFTLEIDEDLILIEIFDGKYQIDSIAKARAWSKLHHIFDDRLLQAPNVDEEEALHEAHGHAKRRWSEEGVIKAFEQGLPFPLEQIDAARGKTTAFTLSIPRLADESHLDQEEGDDIANDSEEESEEEDNEDGGEASDEISSSEEEDIPAVPTSRVKLGTKGQTIERALTSSPTKKETPTKKTSAPKKDQLVGTSTMATILATGRPPAYNPASRDISLTAAEANAREYYQLDWDEMITYQIGKKGEVINIAEAVSRAQSEIKYDEELLHDTVLYIYEIFHKQVSSTSANQAYANNNFLRAVVRYVEKRWEQLSSGTEAVPLHPKGVYLAIRYCNPAPSAPINESLNGYLLKMGRADLLQPGELVCTRQTTTREPVKALNATKPRSIHDKNATNAGYDTVLMAISNHMDRAIAEARDKIAAGMKTKYADLENKYDQLAEQHAALEKSFITFTDKTIDALYKVKRVDELNESLNKAIEKIGHLETGMAALKKENQRLVASQGELEGKMASQANQMKELTAKESPHADKPSVEPTKATARTPVRPPRPAAIARTARSLTKTLTNCKSEKEDEMAAKKRKLDEFNAN